MSKLSYKTLFIIFFFLLIAVVILSRFVLPNKKVSASWWNDSWRYRQYFPITNTSGSNQANFVIKINLDTSSLINLNKIQNNCNDIRVINTDGDLLQHFTTQCNTSSTNLYVKIPNISSSGTGVYIYYGLSDAPNIETNSIFTYFESFDTGTTIVPWSTAQISIGVTNNLVNKGNYSLKFTAQGSNWDNLFQTFPTSNNWTDNYLEYEFYSDIAGSTPIWYTDPRDSSNNRMNPWKNTTISGGSWVTFSQDLNTNSYKNDIKSIQYFTGNDNDNRQIYLDNFRIRKCTSTVYSGTPQSEELSPAPIAYWKFGEGVGTSVYNSSSTNFQGIMTTGTSAPTWTFEDQCISDKCLTLYGTNSYINIGTSLNYLFTDQNFTIESWINPARLDGADVTNYEIFGNESYQNYGILFRLDIHGTPGALSFRTSQSGTVQTTSSRRITVANTWYHVAAVRNGSSIRIYINGIDSTTSAGNHINPVLSTAAAHISGGQSFNGKMDEVKIYPYARTAAQIKQDYNSRGSFKGSSVNLGVKSNTAPDLKSKLVAHYKFDEGNGTIANNFSTNGTSLNCTLSGTTIPIWTNEGKFNKALNFNGINNYLYKSDNDLLDLRNNGFSATVWVKGPTQTGNHKVIVHKGASSSTFAGYWLSIKNDGKMDFAISDGSDWVINWISGNKIITDNKWHHLAFSWNPENGVTLFVDGIVDVFSNNTSIVDINGSDSFKIGGFSSSGYSFNGLIDEVKIYNTALTADEIKQDYNAGSAIQFGSTNQTIGGTTTSLEYCIPGDTSYCASPIAEWKLDEKVGTSIVDTSGNNNTGIFGAGSSSPTWTQGKIGSGLKFDVTKSNYVSGPLDGTGLTDFSYDFWFKTNTVSGTVGILQWAPVLSSGSPMVYVSRNGANINVYNSGAYSSSIAISPDIWYHFSSVYSAGTTTTTLYLNGISKVTFGRQLTYYNYGTNLYLGNGYNGFFDGIIDHVKIYNYARTPAQIAYDYNKGAPIGWWKFDECQGNIAYDWSGIGNTGSINIGPSGSQNSLGTCQIGTSAAWTNGTTGKINSSLNLDGTDDRISIGNPTNLQVEKGDFTVSAWLYPTSVKCGMEAIAKSSNIMCGSPTVGGWMIGSSSDYKWKFRVSDSTNLLYKDATSPTLYSLNTWSHVTGIKKNNNIYLFINGKEVASNDITGLTIDSNKNLYLGGFTAAAWLWPGKIDDVRIYNYALTSEQIKQVYNGGAVNFQ